MNPIVGRADARNAGLQRMVINGDVIYVHQQPSQRPEPAPVQAPPVEEEPEAVALASEAEAPEPDDEADGYTPPPQGYAYEFGTGRLVPIRPDVIRAW